MKNVIKACLLVAAFAFAAGCSTHEGPSDKMQGQNVSNIDHNAHHGHSKCKHHHHCGKLGAEKVKKDCTK